MADDHVVLEGVKEYTRELLGTVFVEAARDSASRSESAASRSESARDAAESTVTDALNNAAGMVRDEVKDDADRAASSATAAGNSASSASSAANRAETAATRAENAADGKADTDVVNARPALFSGPGGPPPLSELPHAVAGDKWLNETEMTIHVLR